MIVIKQAVFADYEILQNLNNNVFIENIQYDSDLKVDWALSDKGKKYFQQLLKIKGSYCLIAYDDNEPVGYIACRLKDRNYCHSRYFEIENMGIDSKYQSQGIGSNLINQVVNYAKKQGYQKLYVNAYSKNLRAIKFYKKSGFAEIDLGLVMDL